ILPVPGIFEYRTDFDLHNHVPGRLWQTIVGQGDIFPVTTFDPVSLGRGSHKAMLSRTQAYQGIEQVATLLVFDLVVGDELPPPPPSICQDHAASNFGGTLPCVFTTPPPPPPPPPPVVP